MLFLLEFVILFFIARIQPLKLLVRKSSQPVSPHDLIWNPIEWSILPIEAFAAQGDDIGVSRDGVTCRGPRANIPLALPTDPDPRRQNELITLVTLRTNSE